MYKKVTLLIALILALDLTLLMLFGRTYTKLLIIKPFFYAHDLVMLIMVFLSIPYFKFTKRIKSIEWLFGIAILYLFYSLFSLGVDKAYIILRQFMLFGYGIFIYIVLNRIFSLRIIENNFTQYIIYFGFLCFTVQVLYVIYLLLFKDYNPFFQRNYFSPIIILCFLVTASYVFTYIKNSYLKHVLFALIFLIALTTGHDSTYLSLVLLYFTYLFLHFNLKYKVISVTILLLMLIGVFVFVPSFTDLNMQWRVLFWKESFLRSANNYFVFGEGFGIQYASDTTIVKLNNIFSGFESFPKLKEDNKYLTAAHNSFISMI